MYDFLPLIIVFVAMAVMMFIVLKKFPQLSLIDVESLPEVKEEKKKDEYIRKRQEKKVEKDSTKAKKYVEKIAKWFSNIQLLFRKYVGNVQKKVLKGTFEKAKTVAPEKKEERKVEIGDLLDDANRSIEKNALEEAEKKFIDVVRLDPKSTQAYYGLVGVYLKQGMMQEAEQTCAYLLQLDPDNDQAHERMAEIAEENGNTEKAIEHYEQAVLISDIFPKRFDRLSRLLSGSGQPQTALEAGMQALAIEPENPRYLDNCLELAIIVADRGLAEELYGRLRLVNPDNNKLDAFKQRISEIVDNS